MPKIKEIKLVFTRGMIAGCDPLACTHDCVSLKITTDKGKEGAWVYVIGESNVDKVIYIANLLVKTELKRIRRKFMPKIK